MQPWIAGVDRLLFLLPAIALSLASCQSRQDALRAKADKAYAEAAYAPANRLYSELLEQDPNLTEARFFRGVCLQMQGEHVQAIADFERVVEEDPEAYKAWLNLGHCHYAQSDWERARNSYAKVLDLKPDYGLALNPLAHMNFYLGDTAEACLVLEQAAKVMADRSVDDALRRACGATDQRAVSP